MINHLMAVSLILSASLLYKADGNIGSTLGESQRNYNFRGTRTDDDGVTWNFKGWRITEYYDPQGSCDMIRYEGNDYSLSSESEILAVLRINTPKGVLWKEDTPSTAWGGFQSWHSTEYIKNGVITENLVATLSPVFRQNGVNSDGVQTMIGNWLWSCVLLPNITSRSSSSRSDLSLVG